MARIILLAVAAALTATCTVDSLVTVGRPCSATQRCGPGAVCDLARGLCVKPGPDSAPGDLTRSDSHAERPSGDAPPSCTDGTRYGACSTTRPKLCQAGNLVDRCTGPDGVSGNADDCGCPAGATCRSDGTCCAKSCEGKTCGSDGCGGSCGTCDGFPCGGSTPICRSGTCAACECPNNCYNIVGYCGAQGGVLKDCYLMAPTASNSNYCVCTVHCSSGVPADLVIGDSRDPQSGDCQ